MDDEDEIPAGMQPEFVPRFWSETDEKLDSILVLYLNWAFSYETHQRGQNVEYTYQRFLDLAAFNVQE